MNQDQAAGQWQQFKGKLKETWGKMTDDDLELYKGKKDQFFGKLKEHHGIEREEAEKQSTKLEKECNYSCDSASKTKSAA
jgi:uncharacterized protein YjbJ (UPF0337 family)